MFFGGRKIVGGVTHKFVNTSVSSSHYRTCGKIW